MGKFITNGQEIRLSGYPICPGIAIAKPFFYLNPDEEVPEFSVENDKIEAEVARYYNALKKSKKDLISMKESLQRQGGSESAAILRAHIEMIQDPMMTVDVEKEIRSRGKNTEYVFKSVIGEFEQRFSRITDTFFKERLKDVQDISKRVIRHLRKHERCELKQIQTPSIIFAHELLPSDTAEVDKEMIEAFVTRSGGETSHVAIMARAKGIPFVSSVDFPDLSLAPPPLVIVDGQEGVVIINPTSETLQSYKRKQEQIQMHNQGLKERGIFDAETIDGYQVHLTANVEMFSELDCLPEYGGHGVGLFRSEYLFLARDGFPSEEEQFTVYKNLVEKVGNFPSVIRTFDIGGDKLGSFHPTRFEKNPYLGCRATRLMLKERSIFKAQIRAMLRASAFGQVSILFPMISGVGELREAKSIVEEAKQELLRARIPFARTVPLGCMIEVPSAAVTCDLLARECDFISIGTNDLVQYTIAVDRGNSMMSYLYTPCHPSILRMIKMVVDEGNSSQIPVSVCGEIAGNPRYTPLLLGLGVQELSVSTSRMPLVKNVIRLTRIVDATSLADYMLTLTTAKEVEDTLEEAFEKLQIGSTI